jgi:hypothetical protein
VADLAGLDVSIFRALNDFCGWSPTLDRVVVHLEVLKGSLFMGIVGVLWYWPDKDMPRRRQTLLTMILRWRCRWSSTASRRCSCPIAIALIPAIKEM